MKKTFYVLRLFKRVQNKNVEICDVEHWFNTTIKRDAQRMANRINREKGYVKRGTLSCDIDKWIAPVPITYWI